MKITPLWLLHAYAYAKMAQQLQCTFPQGDSRMYIVLWYVYIVCMHVYSCIPIVKQLVTFILTHV